MLGKRTKPYKNIAAKSEKKPEEAVCTCQNGDRKYFEAGEEDESMLYKSIWKNQNPVMEAVYSVQTLRSQK